MNGCVGLRKWNGLIFALFLIASVFATRAGAATWTHSVLEGYDVWYLNGTSEKFRYNLTSKQWSHLSTIGSTWYAISATGRPNAFIGDGAWWDLGNGFSYQYSAGYDKGTFRDGAADRFLYKYASGQWYHTADTVSWQVLGKGGLSGAFVGTGAWYDLGNGFSYQYSAGYDKGSFKEGLAQRFLYKYASGQWYHTGNILSWQVLGAGGLNAAFMGDGRWHDLGDGFDYQFSIGYHKGTFEEDYARFLYKYHKNQWWHGSQTLKEWYALSAEGASASFVGDGRWHNLVDGPWPDLIHGLDYQFSIGYHKGIFHAYSADFLYKYHKNQWWHKNYPTDAPWYPLSAEGISANFVGDGQWHELGYINGANWRYRYYELDGEYGEYAYGIWQRFANGDWKDRFMHDYESYQWDFAEGSSSYPWQPFGWGPAGCQFLGDGIRHELSDFTLYWDMRYDGATDMMYIGLETSFYQGLHSSLEMFRYRFGDSLWEDRNQLWNNWHSMGDFDWTDSGEARYLEWWGSDYHYYCVFGNDGQQNPYIIIVSGGEAYKHDLITADWWYCPDYGYSAWESKGLGDTTAYGWR